MMTSKQDHTLSILSSLVDSLPRDTVLTSSSPTYRLHAEPFSIDKHQHPSIVFVPRDVPILSKIIAYLYKSDLDFNIRGRGFKSPSAKDVIVSMMAFDGFEYDKEKKVATVGAGSNWRDVVARMEEIDPGYMIPVARTPAIGVAGTITTGGLSWMSTEYGCIADPINFLDAEVVKYDGSVVMASSEPDLLWALRGGGGGFGVITKVLLRAHNYPTAIYSGMILIPRRHLHSLVADAVKFLDTHPHPKVNFFAYVAPKHLLHTYLEPGEGTPDEDIVVIHAYDAFGEEHGRKAFRWALGYEGAIDRTRTVTMKEIVDMQHNADVTRGTTKMLYAPMGVESLSHSEMIKAIEWHEGLASIDQKVQELSIIIFEFLVTRSPFGGVAETAWARPVNMNHLLLIIVSAPADGEKEQEDLIRDLLVKAPKEILGDKSKDAQVNPAGMEHYHDVKHTYGLNYEKLLKLRRQYDPARRLKGLVNP